MLFIDKTFKTAVAQSDDGFIRVCTGHTVAQQELTCDDCQAREKSDGSLVICSRRDVWNLVKGRIVATWLLALGSFVGICVSAYIAYSDQMLRANAMQFSWKYVVVALFTLLFVGLFHQGYHPIVHDNADHWVDLKNGSSNLCGGIVVRRKARWS